MRMEKRPLSFDFTITGFIIAIVMITLIIIPTFTLFMSEVQSVAGITSNTTLGLYNKSAELHDLMYAEQGINNSINVQQDVGVLDVIGGYFNGAVNALKITLKSITIFNSLTVQAASDIPVLGYFQQGLTILVMIMILIGVIISAYLKYRV